MKFLLTIIIIIFLAGFFFSNLLPWMMRSWLKRMHKKFETKPDADKRSKGSVRQKKRMSETVGEYVDFEEINEA